MKYMKKLLFSLTAILVVLCMSFASCTQKDELTDDTVNEQQSGTYKYKLHMNCAVPSFDGLSTRAATSWTVGSVVYFRFLKSGTSSYITGKATYDGSSWSFETNSALSSTTSNTTCEALYVENPTSTNSSSIKMSPTSIAYKGAGTYSCSSTDINVTVTLTPITSRMRFRGTSGTSITLQGDKTDIKYVSSITLSTLSVTTEYSDVSLNVSSNDYTPYIYGTFVNSTGNNTITIANNSESKIYQITDFLGSNLPTGSSGYLTIPNKSNYSNYGWAQINLNNYKLNVASKQLTVIAAGAASDFTYESDVNKMYAGYFLSSKLSGMDNEEMINYVMSDGLEMDNTSLDNIISNDNFESNDNVTLLAVGVAKDGSVGTLYKKSFTIPSKSNQPEVSISNVGPTTDSGQKKWQWTIQKNSYCNKYYQLLYVDYPINDCFAAWLFDAEMAAGTLEVDTDNTTWTCSRESSESTFDLYVRGATSYGTLSNVINSAHANNTSYSKSRKIAEKRSGNETLSKSKLQNVKVRCVSR